jgi:hypothetical protein
MIGPRDHNKGVPCYNSDRADKEVAVGLEMNGKLETREGFDSTGHDVGKKSNQD